MSIVNLFQSSVAFHVETSHLICTANQINGFYIKCNNGLKWVKYTSAIRETCSVMINPFVPNALFPYPLKTTENLTVFCFQGYRKGALGKNGLKIKLCALF